MKLSHLFSPFSMGTLRLENRIVMPAMATNFATSEGFVTDRQISYYLERAKGGVGYMNTEHTGILQQGKSAPNMLLASTDEHIPGLKKLSEAIRGAGGKLVVQINHAGRQTLPAVTGMPIVGPSPLPATPVPDPTGANIPRELTLGEIEGIIDAYAAAALRVKKAGADGVEIHMAHGYLICSFLSPFSNRRSDRYGGDIHGRSRFAVEVLRSVRETVGSDFPVICRLSGDEYVEGGLKIEETVQIAKILEKEGADALHISACNAASGYLNHPTYYVQEGVFVHLARAVKSVVGVPVIAVGRIRNPLMADRIIGEGSADLVSMGRALIADPYLPVKAREGRFDQITPCISCNRCILTLRKGTVRCAVNPEAGFEEHFRIAPAPSPRRVWIVGGGPGGLKAAETAARRGHHVTLFEKRPALGGKMRVAALPPNKEVLNDFMDYLERRVKGLGVTLELGKTFTADMAKEGRPDVVVLATGAIPWRPDWPGVEASGALFAEDVLSTGAETIGKKVLVIGGGGAGAETADYLSEKGKDVTLVEMLDTIASNLVFHLQHYLKKRLEEKEVEVLTSTRVKEVGKGFALVEDRAGQKRLEGFDALVLAAGWTPERSLLTGLEGEVPEIYVIGDAVEPREALEAVFEGEDIGMRI